MRLRYGERNGLADPGLSMHVDPLKSMNSAPPTVTVAAGSAAAAPALGGWPAGLCSLTYCRVAPATPREG
jgi:hypothetical protein